MTRHAIAIAMGLWGLFSVSGVRADAVGPPPTDCPAGTHGESSHTGPYCRPLLCTTDADCTGRATCREQAMCIAQQACGGLSFDGGPYPDGGFPPPCMFDAVHGLCTSGGPCGTGTCEMRRVCASPTPPPSTSGCACNVGDRGYALGAWFVALGIAITLVRRTSQKRR